ncbi:DUF4258 domain-containing protein [Acidobacteria bacterium AH-259-L09]|nr:DUF4258 domain-containing protein [Acidobacteria bacterium AH-259-L09]
MQNDRLHLDDVFHSVKHGEIIEDYPHDKILPSCLVFATGSRGQPIHSVWAYNQESK